jgi:hypothetical protein
MATKLMHRCGSEHNTSHQVERHKLHVLMVPPPDGGSQLVPVQCCAVLAALRANTLAGQIKSWSGTEAGLKERRAALAVLRLGTIDESQT